MEPTNTPAPEAAPAATAPTPAPAVAPTLDLAGVIAAQVGDGNDPTEPVAPAAPASAIEPEPEPQVPAGAENPDAVRNALQAERTAAREARDLLRDAQTQLAELATVKGDLENRATTAEAEVTRLQAIVDRYEVARDKGVDLGLATRLRGDTRDELEADADTLLSQIVTGVGSPARPLDLDTGPRTTAPRPKPDPEKAHGQFIAGLLGGQS